MAEPDPWQATFDAIEAGVAKGVFPGAVGLVWHAGATLYHEAHGALASHAAASVSGRPVVRDTVYDLASLTKVVCTTTLVAQAASRGQLRLDDPVPEPWSAACPGATLGDLLEHCAGLAAHREYFTTVAPFDAAKVLHHVIHTPRQLPPRERAIYSDLGFMILGAWLERVLDQPLDEALADRVAYRLGVDAGPVAGLGFRRVHSRAALGWAVEQRIAPTEAYDPALHPDGVPSYFAVRQAQAEGVVVAHGVVHDDNAFVMGGVAGHAGLFGTAEGVAEWARAWAEDRVPDVSTAVRDRFWRRSQVEGSTRCLGFDGIPGDGSGATGTALSPATVGHTGFTGTSVWIDPAAEGGPRVAVLLTNRVHLGREHQGRDGTGIREARQAFHAAAARLR